MKSIKLIFCFLFINSSFAYTQVDESWKVYDDTEVAVIDIFIDPIDLQYLYDNPSSDTLFLAQVHFKNSELDEIIDSVGIGIRGNTSRESAKKSFKLSFNTFVSGRKFYSLEKINLNGEHNDPSIVRSKLCWDLFNTIGVKSTRSSHAAVYINGNYYGLYISVEHIDENFIKKNFPDDSGNLWKCLFGADLNYISSDPNSYKIGSGDSRVYNLKTNEAEDDFTKLAELIDFLNNSSDETFRNEVFSKIDVASVMNYFAVNVITGSWDDYWSLSNNYYLYHEPSMNKFFVIPYDYDNTFGVDWSNIDWASVNPYTFGKVDNGYRPLIERFLQFPEFHNLFTHFIEFIINQRFNTSLSGYEIYQLKNKIQSWAENDFYRSVDYGFTLDDFNNSFFQDGYSKYHVKYSIQDFIDKRIASLKNQLNYVSAFPIVYDYEISSTEIYAGDTITVSCSAFSNNGIKSINIESTNLISNQIQIVQLTSNESYTDLNLKNRDSWKGILVNLPEDYWGNLKLVVTDSSNNTMKYPSEGITIRTPGNVTREVLVSELMSSNISTVQDLAGEYEDWLELYNPQDTSVVLSGKYLTDKKDNLKKWQFPANVVIEPHKQVLIWCDEDQEQAGPHINFKLSSNGEFVALVESDGITIVDSVTFPALNDDNSYARIDNIGEWVITSNSTPGQSNVLTDAADDIKTKFSYSINAYPNPFNPSITIKYSVPSFSVAERSNVTQQSNVETHGHASLQLAVYDVLGREVAKLVNQKHKPGNYEIIWEASDQPSGVYFLNINGKYYKKTLKLILLR